MQAFARLLTPNWMNLVINAGKFNKLTTFSGQVMRSDQYIFVSQSLIDQDRKVFLCPFLGIFRAHLWKHFRALSGTRKRILRWSTWHQAVQTFGAISYLEIPYRLICCIGAQYFITNFNILIGVASMKSPCVVFCTKLFHFLGCFIVQTSMQCDYNHVAFQNELQVTCDPCLFHFCVLVPRWLVTFSSACFSVTWCQCEYFGAAVTSHYVW